MGLGLAIAKENVELLGGKITLVSEKGKGSKFTISIPFSQIDDNNHVKKKNTEHKIKNTSTNHTILIVEDEELNFLYLSTLLENYINKTDKILYAKNGKEAVEICKNNTSISLVLMDLKMPIMNGFDATKIIKSHNPNITIIAQTSYSTQDNIEKAFAFGFNDFITKPIEKLRIEELLNKYLY